MKKQGTTIAVLAGTPVDTMLGANLLHKNGFNTQEFPLSKTPQEQDLLQCISPQQLMDSVYKICQNIKNLGITCCFVYCNSLASAIDFTNIAKTLNLLIITPFSAYKIIAKQLEHLFILSANSVALHAQETFFKTHNETMSIISMGFLDLVQAIEEKKAPQSIIIDFKLDALLNFYEKLPIKKTKAILLGCTHFSVLANMLKNKTNIPVIDPSDTMVELLHKNIK